MLTKEQLKSILHTALIHRIDVDILSVLFTENAINHQGYKHVLRFEINDENDIQNHFTINLSNKLEPLELWRNVMSHLIIFIDENDIETVSLDESTFNKLDEITEAFFSVMTDKKLSLNFRMFHKTNINFIADNATSKETFKGKSPTKTLQLLRKSLTK